MKKYLILMFMVFLTKSYGQTLRIPFNKTAQTVWVDNLTDLPIPQSGVIKLEKDHSYIFNARIDLMGSRIQTNGRNSLVGSSSETQEIKSSGLSNTLPLIESDSTLVIKDISLIHAYAVNLNAATSGETLTWEGVNFINSHKSNFVGFTVNLTSCAFLESDGLYVGGSFSSFVIQNSLINSAQDTAIKIDAVVSSRCRIVYSSFITSPGETSLYVNTAGIPDQRFVINYCNFAGGGMYLTGINHLSSKAVFHFNGGISNTLDFTGWDTNQSDDFNGVYSSLTGIPSQFQPVSHNHTITEITGLNTALNAKFNNPTGNSSQYVRGDGNIVNFPSIVSESTTVTDGSIIDFTLTGSDITATIINGSITPSKLSQTYLTSEVDGSTSNELQTLTLTGNQLSISNGNSQTFTGWDTDASNDFSGVYSNLTGIPSTFTPSTHTHNIGDLTQSGATLNQIIKWNGTAWAAGTDNGTTYTAGTGIGIVGNVISNLGLIPTTLYTGDVAGTYDNLQLQTSVVGTSELVDANVTNTKLSNMTGNTIKGRLTSSGTPQDLTVSEVQDLLGLPKTISLVSNVTTLLATPVTTGLTFTGVANTKYQITVNGVFQSAATTTGIGLAIDIPSGSVCGVTFHPSSATAMTNCNQIADNSTTGAGTTGVPTANTDTKIQGEWIVVIGATGGVVDLTFKSEVATSLITLIGGRFDLTYKKL